MFKSATVSQNTCKTLVNMSMHFPKNETSRADCALIHKSGEVDDADGDQRGAMHFECVLNGCDADCEATQNIHNKYPITYPGLFRYVYNVS